MLLAVLGRQPEIGLAELESALSAPAITPVGKNLALIDFSQSTLANAEMPEHRLVKLFPYKNFGSIIKFAKVCGTVKDASNTHKTLSQYITKERFVKEGIKLKIGISDYSGSFAPRRLNDLGLTLKKDLKHQGFSVRVVPNKTPALGSAQIIHNSLTKDNGYEFVLFKQAGKLHFAQTVYEQDIEAYAARDQARPKRDARVGMLPPKLAQTIINLALGPLGDLGLEDGSLGQEKKTRSTTYQSATPTILDPFCGTGVVLQEAVLMGYNARGSDISERMVQYSTENLTWLCSKRGIEGDVFFVEQGDAATHRWDGIIDYVACETYLGEPLAVLPPREALERIVSEVNRLHAQTLKNLARQLKPGTRLCLAVPAWQTPRGFIHLPVLDQLSKFGYNQLVFSHVDAKNLVYARANQIVARQLVVLQKA